MTQTSSLHSYKPTDQTSNSQSQPNFERDCPGVEIQRGNIYTIILEELDRDVHSGATENHVLMKKINEKRVKLPTDLITFITSSGAISKYNTRFKRSFRNPVSLEVGSELVLSSVSSDDLNEAWAAVQRDLSVDTVVLQGAVALSPDLDRVKEVLNKAKSEANCQEFKVDVRFIPGISGPSETKVRMVGYTETVNKLKDVLNDYQMNQVEVQDAVNLPHPELVGCFDGVLSLIGMKQTKVTLKSLHFPCPYVLLSGPRCHVQEAKQALTSTLASLTIDTLVLDGPGAQRYFQAKGKVIKYLIETSCHVLIRELQDVTSTGVKTKSPSISSTDVTPRLSIPRWHSKTAVNITHNKTSLKIKLGNLEDEEVNVLVIPMLNKQLASTKIGKHLLKKAGSRIMIDFTLMTAKHTFKAGDVLQIDASQSLGCSKLFFIECLPWDEIRGESVQALSNGLKKCLDLCVRQGFSSVAFPVIGPGVLLKYPLREAIQVLTGSIRQFGSSTLSSSLSTIHVVIQPGNRNSEQCYQDVYRHLSASMNQGDQVIFRSLASDLDDVTITVGGGVKLQVVLGDISCETTDAVVNTTNFVDFQRDGVCKDIITKAGPQLEAFLRTAIVNSGEVFKTEPGSFPCKAILHVYGENNASIVERLVCHIIELCESSGYKSVAIPAICTGGGGMDPGVIARAILQGVKTATSSTSLCLLTNIRLVLIEVKVFLAFKRQATQLFPSDVFNTVSVSTAQLTNIPQQQTVVSVNADQSCVPTTSSNQQQKSAFMFLGLHRKNVDDAMTKLGNLYQAQCSTVAFSREDLQDLTQEDMNNLSQLVEILGLYMQKDQSGLGSLTVSGLKEGVNQVIQVIHTISLLRREVRAKEEEHLYSRVAWCIMGDSGEWERLPKRANRNLEKKLTLPLYWDTMAQVENLKVVALNPFSAEYQTVEKAFRRTVTMTIKKIERLQNIHLRWAYEVYKKHISDKNGRRGAGEKILYHGTSQDNCDSIIKTGFNRRFAGQN
ncbi:hypothetical protein INR49_025439, partial [Caranx melampygus]